MGVGAEGIGVGAAGSAGGVGGAKNDAAEGFGRFVDFDCFASFVAVAHLEGS